MSLLTIHQILLPPLSPSSRRGTVNYLLQGSTCLVISVFSMDYHGIHAHLIDKGSLHVLPSLVQGFKPSRNSPSRISTLLNHPPTWRKSMQPPPAGRVRFHGGEILRHGIRLIFVARGKWSKSLTQGRELISEAKRLGSWGLVEILI